MKIKEDEKRYGIPEQKKFPMPDAKHVRSAIKFFNYVDPRYEKELASAILSRMKEFGISFDDIGVGENNKFSKYIPKNELEHHGIKGQKWGVRRFQNPDGSLTIEGKKHREGKSSAINPETIKKIGKAAAIGVGIAATAYVVANNSDVTDVVAGVMKTAMNDASIYGAGNVVAAFGRDYAAKAMEKTVKEVVKPAAKKVVVGAAQGIAIAATVKALKSTFGEENYEAAKQAYNAYNKKNKIGNVPDLFGGKKDEDEDDD